MQHVVKQQSHTGNVLCRQGEVVLNFGDSPVKTFGLINCIAIGGVFVDADNRPQGSFITHERPQDIENALTKLCLMDYIIKKRGFHISNTVLFQIEKAGQDKSKYFWDNAALEYPEFCNTIAEYCQTQLQLPLPQVVEYGYYYKHYVDKDLSPEKLALCGKAIINPIQNFTETFRGNIAF